MHIKNTNGLVTVRPANEAETQVLESVFRDIPPNTKLKYAGRDQDPNHSGFSRPHFRYDDVAVILSGTSEDDAHATFGIRDMHFWGGASTVFRAFGTDEQGVFVHLFVSAPCKICGEPCVTRVCAEHKMCAACTDVCTHIYKYGAIHGGTSADGRAVDIGFGRFCKKCGSGHPDDDSSSKTIAEHHAIALATGVVDHIIYRDGSTATH